MPGAINYILDITNKEKIIYIGHSQGTTISYVFAIMRPELSDKVLLQISLAPTAMIPHATTVFRKFLPLIREMLVSFQLQLENFMVLFNKDEAITICKLQYLLS